MQGTQVKTHQRTVQGIRQRIHRIRQMQRTQAEIRRRILPIHQTVTSQKSRSVGRLLSIWKTDRKSVLFVILRE